MAERNSFDRLLPILGTAVRLLSKLRHRQTQRGISSLRERYYREYWQSTAQKLGGRLEDVGQSGFIRLHFNGRSTFIRSFEVQIDDHIIYSIAGDKTLSQNLLKSENLPIPNHVRYELGCVNKAIDFMNGLDKSVVVKPVNGAGGLGVTTGIRDRKALWRASFAATAVSRELMVEEQIPGDNYRFLYLDGVLIDVVRRNPPTILGDGRNDIRTLIAQENQRRLAAPPWISMRTLSIDTDLRNHLNANQLSLKYIPCDGELLSVKHSISQNGARDNCRITSGIHPSFLTLGRRIQKVLNIRLLGVDVIAKDIGLALEDSGGVINEINTTPAPHHHDLIAEPIEKSPVGKLIMEYIFSSTTCSGEETTPRLTSNG